MPRTDYVADLEHRPEKATDCPVRLRLAVFCQKHAQRDPEQGSAKPDHNRHSQHSTGKNFDELQ
jgi:hypothetical protein